MQPPMQPPMQPAGQPAQPPQQQPAQQQPAPRQGGDRVAMLQKLRLAGMKLLYSDRELLQKLLDVVGQAQDPAAGVANATMMLLEHMKSQVKGVDPNTVYLALVPMAVEVATVAAAAGVIEDDAQIVQRVIEVFRGGGAQQPTSEAPPAPEMGEEPAPEPEEEVDPEALEETEE